MRGDEEILEHEVAIYLTKGRKLPTFISCVCGEIMRRRFTRPGAVYRCPDCGSETTLDPDDLKRYNVKERGDFGA